MTQEKLRGTQENHLHEEKQQHSDIRSLGKVEGETQDLDK